MSDYRYEVGENNEVRIWNDEYPNPDGSPFIFQPKYPGGDAWLDRDDAAAWAESYIANMLDVYGTPLPKSYPNEEPQYAQQPEE